ncbi:hypothetical protein RCCGE510_12016 [Rhizobium sp. CCGE 510]|nr:hypothetical protein RCCGE510_12016 [Rhizobium sp. CCGE 510]
MPSKKTIFTPLSILFRPHQKPAFEAAGFWWRRRVPPPGPIGLLHRSFIAIAGPKAGTGDIVVSSADGKGKRHKSVMPSIRNIGKMPASDWFPAARGLN